MIGLLSAFLPAYAERQGWWVIDGETVRWLGVFFYLAGGALRICVVAWLLGAGESWLVAGFLIIGAEAPKPTRKTVTTEDGLNLVCEVRGAGDTALVFLHGWCGDREYWKLSEPLRGRIGVSLVFAFTALGHFIKTAEMTQMLPAWVPMRLPLIYLTGVFELLAAIAILITPIARSVGLALCIFLLLILPSNVYAAFQ